MGVSTLEQFRAEVGSDGPVAVVGGRTRWEVGGALADGCRLVRAPTGIAALDPAEMTVRLGAGTTLDELEAALTDHGQEVAVDGPPGATVGGSLAVGRDGLRRLRLGPARDALLQAEFVDGRGRLVKAGGPTVKNVTGYDLCRLLVGSLGTLGLLGEVILRTRPRPEASAWLAGPAHPDTVRSRCYRPASLLWDGTTTYVRLEGYGEDVDAEAASLADLGLVVTAGPPAMPPHRHRYAAEGPMDGIADLGSSVAYRAVPAPAPIVPAGIQRLAERLRAGFDPAGRLNPGRDPYREAA